MSIHSLHSEHPALACARTIGEALDAVAEVDPAYLTSAQKADALRDLSVAVERVAGLRLRVLAAAGPRSATGCPRAGSRRRRPA